MKNQQQSPKRYPGVAWQSSWNRRMRNRWRAMARKNDVEMHAMTPAFALHLLRMRGFQEDWRQGNGARRRVMKKMNTSWRRQGWRRVCARTTQS